MSAYSGVTVTGSIVHHHAAEVLSTAANQCVNPVNTNQPVGLPRRTTTNSDDRYETER